MAASNIDRVQPIAGRPENPLTRAATVVVACKLPTGLELQLCHETTWMEDTPSGSRERKRFDRGGPTVTLRGNAYPVGQAPAGFPDRPQLVGGFALTYGVDKEFFDKWMDQNKLNPLVTGHMIFGAESAQRVRDMAREYSELRSGLEPIIPDNDSRMPRPINASVTAVQTADEMRGRAAMPAYDE